MRQFRGIILCISACVLLLASCKQDPVKDAVRILDEATVKVEKCNNEKDAIKITEETGEKLKKLDLKNDDLTQEQQKELTDALVKYMQACMKQKMSTEGASNPKPILEVTPEDNLTGMKRN